MSEKRQCAGRAVSYATWRNLDKPAETQRAMERCSRHGTPGAGPWYCWQHDPERIKHRMTPTQMKARIAELEALLTALAKSDTESEDAEQWRLDHGLDDTPQGLELVMQYQNDLQDCIDEGRAILGVVHE